MFFFFYLKKNKNAGLLLVDRATRHDSTLVRSLQSIQYANKNDNNKRTPKIPPKFCFIQKVATNFNSARIYNLEFHGAYTYIDYTTNDPCGIITHRPNKEEKQQQQIRACEPKDVLLIYTKSSVNIVNIIAPFQREDETLCHFLVLVFFRSCRHNRMIVFF